MYRTTNKKGRGQATSSIGGEQKSWGSILLATTLGVATLLLTATLPAAGAAAAVDAEQFEAQVRARTDETLGGLVRDGRSSFAAAVFVQNGRVAFEQAYGLEQPDPNVPFSIDATHVDLNSIRKVFTATAVAKLVSEGKIASIDDPINRYLTHFKLPLAFGHEVTIRQVATHTAGFDEAAFGAGPVAERSLAVLRAALPPAISRTSVSILRTTAMGRGFWRTWWARCPASLIRSISRIPYCDPWV